MFILLHYHYIHSHTKKKCKLITYINSTLTITLYVIHTYFTLYLTYNSAESKPTSIIYIINIVNYIYCIVGSFVTFYHIYFSNKSVSLTYVHTYTYAYIYIDTHIINNMKMYVLRSQWIVTQTKRFCLWKRLMLLLFYPFQVQSNRKILLLHTKLFTFFCI